MSRSRLHRGQGHHGLHGRFHVPHADRPVLSSGGFKVTRPAFNCETLPFAVNLFHRPPMIRYAYCIAAVLFVALVGSKFDRQTGFTSLIRFGETWQNRRLHSLENLPIATVEKSSGYDGQFYAQIALDPLLRDTELNRAIDAPAYRARRILTPAVAAVLGAGNAWWTLQVYALLNVISWFALAWLLRTWIAGNDWTGFARWGACMFSLGVLDSVRQSLVDLPALLLLSLAIRASTRVQPSKSILWLAFGNLAKETTLIGTVALCIIGYSNGSRWRRTFLLSLIPALPLLAWWLYVDHRFSAIPSTEGLGNFTWPLLGLFVQVKSCLHELLLGNFDSRFSFGLLAVIGLTAQTSVLCVIEISTHLGGASVRLTRSCCHFSVFGCGLVIGRPVAHCFR